ncbi:hypothetical protein [Cellulomonas sp. 73-92]|uniref:site-specific integrase n=1 Tax=Cellulomonas sp. 73-92 TaxID=1895740 RepID=UPI000A6A2374|nr:hypothetical protein [Cellulomonas sp. 73-92]
MSPAAGKDAPLRVPPLCNKCQRRRVAWSKPRVDFCYHCLPGGPFTPPPCARCGSTTDYFSQGLCQRCHPRAPEKIGSCKDCLAWGVFPQHNFLCWTCRWWRTHYPRGVCDYCGRDTTVGDQGACRLCLEQARMLQEPGRALDLAGANKHGQQLFFANMQFQRFNTRRAELPPRRVNNWKTPGGWGRPGPPPKRLALDEWVQPTLIDVEPDPERLLQRALIENSELTRYCAPIVREHAERFGWSKKQRNDVVRSLRLLQTIRDSPTAKIRASDVLVLPRWGGSIASALDVLEAADLLIDDRPRPLELYFTTRTAALPPVMREQLETWMNVLLGGATSAPRQRSRHPLTVKTHLRSVVPAVTAWADAGHQSLAEITPAQVRAALPEAGGSQRALAERGLRSLFKTLKARKLIFANPARGLKGTQLNGTVPLPMDTALIREHLNSPKPVIALAVALVAFHALTAKEVSELLLTDIVDGRLTLDGRVIPLAQPVRERLARWLDYRQQKWPNTQNPYLIVNQRTAPRLMAAGRTYPWQQAGIGPQKLREDRILVEVRATGGDARRLSDLFGLGIESTNRYVDTLGHPALTGEDSQVPGTSTPT